MVRLLHQRRAVPVVIGTDVGDYYQALIASTGVNEADKEQAKVAARQNMTWTERTISHFAEIFFPLLPALISGGLILGFRNVIGDIPMSGGQTLAQMHPAWKTVYDFLWLLGEAIFMFLPVAICWSTVKRWAARRCSASCWASPRCRRS